MNSKKVAVLVGSLRKESYNLKLAKNLKSISPQSIKLDILEIGQLPLYNQDLDNDPPQTWTEYRNNLKNSDAVLFVTPEHNRSIPAALKNALDIGSRPYGQNLWDKKPGAIISLSIGAIGGFGANHQLRQSLVFLNVPTMQQPEAYIGGASELFDERGIITNHSTMDFLGKFMHSFNEWIYKKS